MSFDTLLDFTALFAPSRNMRYKIDFRETSLGLMAVYGVWRKITILFKKRFWVEITSTGWYIWDKQFTNKFVLKHTNPEDVCKSLNCTQDELFEIIIQSFYYPTRFVRRTDVTK